MLREIFEEVRVFGFFKSLKYAYQRVRFGYDDRIMWGFSTYFNQCVPALKEFCENELQEESIKYNKKRVNIFNQTLKKIDNFESMSARDFYKYPNQENELWEFVGKNIGWYWD